MSVIRLFCHITTWHVKMSRAHSVSFRCYLFWKLMFGYAKDEVTLSETARVMIKGGGEAIPSGD